MSKLMLEQSGFDRERTDKENCGQRKTVVRRKLHAFYCSRSCCLSLRRCNSSWMFAAFWCRARNVTGSGVASRLVFVGHEFNELWEVVIFTGIRCSVFAGHHADFLRWAQRWLGANTSGPGSLRLRTGIRWLWFLCSYGAHGCRNVHHYSVPRTIHAIPLLALRCIQHIVGWLLCCRTCKWSTSNFPTCTRRYKVGSKEMLDYYRTVPTHFCSFRILFALLL